MAKALPWKGSFNGGELSPRMAARTDQEKYGAGCSKLENFIPTVQGPLIRRGGTYFINEVSNSANRTWLVPFLYRVTQSYQVELGDKYARFFTNRGVLVEGSLAITGATLANPCVITVSNHGYLAGDQFYIAGVLGMTQLNGRWFKATSVTTNTITLQNTDGVAIDSTLFTAYVSGGTVARVYQIVTPYAVADLTDANGNFLLKVKQSQDVLYLAHPSYPMQQLSRFGNLNWTMAAAAIINGPFQDNNKDQSKTVFVTPTTATVSGAAATSAVTQGVTGFSNGAAGLNNAYTVRLTMASTASFTTGMNIGLSGITGASQALVNGNWSITVVDATHVDLIGSALTSTQIASLSGGTATYAAGKIRLTVSSTTGLTNGNVVNVIGIAGTTEANGVWSVFVVDGTHVDLISSVFTNAYTSGGSLIGRDGSAITITANAPIFNNVGADSLFYLENPLNINIPQWYSGKAVNPGQRIISGVNTYYMLNTTNQTTGNNTPNHYQGTLPDGINGVTWLYEDSGYGIIKLNAITSASTATGTVQVAPPNIVSNSNTQTFIWSLGLFDSVSGYPEHVSIFRDRLVLHKGTRQAGSVTSDYLNFAPKVGGIQTADSGYVITLPTSSGICWVVAQNDLLIGTPSEELLVSEIDPTKAFGPGNIKSRRQTPHGSRFVEAVPIEFVTMFVTKSGQQLRQAIYSWSINGYAAEDMTTLSEHIPKGPDGKQGILQMAWQQEPDLILWCATTDGRLVGFTYNRDQKVMCWHRHPLGGSCETAPLAAKGFTNAVVESVSCMPSPDGTQDDLWVIVRRTVNGVTRRYIEFLMPYFTDVDANMPNAFYVDCGLSYSGPSTNYITGARHLIGQTVDVLAGGGSHPQVVVDSQGGVTLQSPVTVAQIGLPCPARVETMRLEAGSQIGTAQGSLKRIVQVLIRTLKTIGGKFGNPAKGESSYDEIDARRVEDTMDSPVHSYTGDVMRNYPSGYEMDGIMGMLFDKPLPATLVGLRAEVDNNETTQ